MIHSITVSYQNVLIRQPDINDLERLRIWRNDPANSLFLTKIQFVTEEMQMQWFKEYLNDNDHFMFVIEETKELCRMVGSVSLYDFRQDSCECGKIMVGDLGARGKGIGRLGITLALYVGFNFFKLSAIMALAHEDNTPSLITLQRAGLAISGEHPHPTIQGKMEKELLATKEGFNKKHTFLNVVKIEAD